MSSRVPVIGISCCFRTIDVANIGAVRHHTVYEMYADYVRDILGAAPVLIPALYKNAGPEVLGALLDTLDGLLLTGSPSNVRLRPDPSSKDGFSETEDFVGGEDTRRDWTTLPLLKRALERGLPVLGICRGMQEMNVLRGGSMINELHLRQGRIDHRSDKTVPYWERYGPAHPVIPQPDSWIADQLAKAGNGNAPVVVNSLHTQAVDKPGAGISVELLAEDGTVEAIRIADAGNFAYGVQWHIEWHHDDAAVNRIISSAYLEACRSHAALRGKAPI